MYIDALTLANVADEWRVLLAGARLDTIIQPTEHAIAIQCYAPGAQGEGGRNRWIYLSAHPQFARAHITALKPPKIANEPPPFVMLLRKYLEGTRIESIEQPRWERVLTITAGYRHEGEPVRFRLIIEIMGRMSNLILCDEKGQILGSLRRIGADINRYRVIAPNIPYVGPPPQMRTFAGQQLPRLEPTTVSAAQLSVIPADAEAHQPQVSASQPAKGKGKAKQSRDRGKLSQLLTKHLLGFSPLIAREAIYRTTGDPEMLVSQIAPQSDVWEELAWNIRELASSYDTHQWHPQLVERPPRADKEQGGLSALPPYALEPVAFAPYVLEQYAEVPEMLIRESPSLNVLLDDYYARVEWHDAVDDLRDPIRRVLQTQRDRCKRKAERLAQELAVTEEANRYRMQAELLLAYQNEVQQGQPEVTLQNFYAEEGAANEKETIPLDPRFDAVGNANRLFNRYHKLRRALELVPGQIEQNQTELATIEQLLADLGLAENPKEVELVKAEVQTVGYLHGKPVNDKKAKKQQKGKGGKPVKGKSVPPGGGVPMTTRSKDGFTILIGKNSRQNEEVTFHQATSQDMWLHARGVPGSHVIIKAAGREIPQSTLDEAASLAAWYSQARGITNAAVDYTLQRHVRHMKNGGPGMVIYEREHTLYAKPSALA
ncbi:MAG TPA: NFACT RNA binding domain-containing protein [Ktedonobacteraceae bacterium]|nr:NFACT RNA binding domain-containing protein [Ktedonobacteraceae bacterium]